MRRITLLTVTLAVAAAALAQEAGQPLVRPVQPPVRLQSVSPLELNHLRLALLNAQATRKNIDAARSQLKLPPLDLAVINRTKVPLLSVVRSGAFANIKINATRDHYTVAGGNLDRGFLLTGTRLAASVPHPAGMRALKPNDASMLASVLGARRVIDPITDVEIVKTEDGYDISFRRYGALYDLRMVCNDTRADDCSKEEALKLLADTAVLGGGQ